MRLLVTCLAILLSLGTFSQEETRLALVIGNANYDEGELKNPINDARLVAKTLKTLDFDVILVENIPDRRTFINKIKEFGDQREAYDIAFVYYAGHGIQMNSENFLLPTKEVFRSEYDINNYGVSVQNILHFLNRVTDKVNILILDACRNNPFEHYWNPTRSINKGGGLAKIQTPTGSFIAFSTETDDTASDGDGENSVYCKSLCENMLKEYITLDQVFRNVRSEVLNDTKNQQRPIEESQLTGHEFYLVKSVYIDGRYFPYEELIEIGWQYFDNDEPDLADRYFTKAIENEPERPYAYYARGLNYRWGLEFFEGIRITDDIMELAIEAQYKALERLSDNASNDDFRGDIYGEIAIIKLLQDAGGWCNAFQVACKYGNQTCCDHYKDLCGSDYIEPSRD